MVFIYLLNNFYYVSISINFMILDFNPILFAYIIV
jgi:hypothetical protein